MIVEMDRKSEEFIKVSSEYTFKSKLEMWTIICCLRNIINQKIYGDIIETGVWKINPLDLYHLKMTLIVQKQLVLKKEMLKV